MLCNFSEVLEPTLIPGGRIISIGTRFRVDDIHTTEFTTENGWQVVQQSAIELDSKGYERSYWASRFDLASLPKD